ncbi:hypothetical protein PLANPX_1688 [Lacipirellula parvula]|uniref:SMP-30/Gluconolaconase/LRE-like region n=1 Tax=Lacipirellula parvula TaxID=2650471 RepID=A0A5K7XCH2_9BACT|nr:hypothetical protein PLANPX_1688 [Lacipirellula parvula]
MALSRRFEVLSCCLSLSLFLAQSATAEESKPVTVLIEADVVTIDGDASDDAAEEAKEESKDDSDPTGEQPTHKQSALININADGLSQASVQCFCLMGDDQLLAGCTGNANEIRVFDAEGKFLKSIELPVAPEAINVAKDGTILVAGEGELIRLSKDGEIVTKAESPHAAAIREAKKQVREQTIEQHKQQADMLPQMLETYDTAIKALKDQIDGLKDQENADEQLATLEETIKSYESAKEQMKKEYGTAEELTEEKIEEMVQAAIQYKLKVASISSDGDAVYVACGMPAGYGYAVWKLNPDFAEGKEIVSGLSGCCGQMDVQANADGVFVAENSRKRVRRFDAEGKSICDWGKASEGVEGFGSCCNPMNLAFGTNGAVYTAEDTTGRIKRYSNDGKLLSVVGAADVVPGCKKVSIGVDSTGDRVYMLDITKNNVAVLTRVLPDPKEPLADAVSAKSGGILSLLGLE